VEKSRILPNFTCFFILYACIDGALTKENIKSIRKAGFYNIETLQETPYIEKDGRKITSIVIKAVKKAEGTQHEVFWKVERF
jgi:hypothetical protein